MYHCIICHDWFDLKSLWYQDDEDAGVCVECIYEALPFDIESDADAERNCITCNKEA